MIFSNLITSFIQVIFKPKLWIPLLCTLVISTAITLATSTVLEGLMTDIILYPETFPSNAMLSVFLTQYPLEILFSILLMLLMVTLGTVAFISTAKIAKGEKLIKAINSSVIEIRKAFGTTIVLLGAILFALFVLAIISIFEGVNAFIALILLTIFLIIAFVVFVKLIFVLPALSENEVKEAFIESWKFTQKRFWKAILFVILSLIIAIGFGAIIYAISTLVTGSVIELVLVALSETFTSLYFIVAITNYFYSKQ